MSNNFLEGVYITCGIYCYIDKNDNQIVYIGKDSYIDKNQRHKQHFQSSKYDAQPINKILQRNPNRYTYQVLVWNVDSQERLNALEIQYIRQLKPKFNFTDGGDGTSGFKHSEESRKKISEAKKGENNPMYGKTPWNKEKTLSDETRKKMSESKKGKAPWNKGKTNVYSEETRKRMSENNKGENNPMYEKKHSEETKKKISESASKARNTTGFYRVFKAKDNAFKQGFRWKYCYRNKNNKRKVLSSTDLKKLEQKVLLNNLEWKIINEENAKQSLREDKI